MKSKVISIDRYFITKCILICLFLIYTFIVIDFTLINGSFGRNISSNIFLADSVARNEYFAEKINFIPFATVKLFINAYKSGILDTYIVLENIFGNLLVFMPFAFFVPNIFKRINSAPKFFIFISVCVLVIELMQIVLLTGSADIDDFILNVSGAMILYWVLQIPRIREGINKFLFGCKNEGKS